LPEYLTDVNSTSSLAKDRGAVLRTFFVRRRLAPILVFVFGLALFISTLAPGVVFGDPTEYTLMPHLWAILHPPGYAFMTLLVKLWQTLVPVGTLAYRTNLLTATAGAMGGVMVYLTPLPAPFGGIPTAPPARPSPNLMLRYAG